MFVFTAHGQEHEYVASEYEQVKAKILNAGCSCEQLKLGSMSLG